MARNWSLRMLADHASIQKAHLVRLETGQVEPCLIVLSKIAEALGVKIGRLVD